ncbi:MAG: hypothetical protein CMM83_03645 [Rhodospirillales bacterium]|nr:hypothetical protein [Rhodospirillales bacterium]|tara:strand:+ start:9059 stop:9448 length:390 start_codon:yes stop_codon:yes gene_type:complete
MTETTKKTPDKTASKKKEKSEVKSKTTEVGKSSKESIGGPQAVHYGYFSNVKTPEYRSGWDDIWAKNKKTKKSISIRKKERKIVDINFDELPASVQGGLNKIAQRALRNSDKRMKEHKVNWEIKCRVEG